jgi:hypothetical protein
MGGRCQRDDRDDRRAGDCCETCNQEPSLVDAAAERRQRDGGRRVRDDDAATLEHQCLAQQQGE